MTQLDPTTSAPSAVDTGACPVKRWENVSENINPGPDPVVEIVVARMRDRSRCGRKKYGTTLTRTDLNRDQWFQHLQEELIDASLYVETLRRHGHISIPPRPLPLSMRIIDHFLHALPLLSLIALLITIPVPVSTYYFFIVALLTSLYVYTDRIFRE